MSWLGGAATKPEARRSGQHRQAAGAAEAAAVSAGASSPAGNGVRRTTPDAVPGSAVRLHSEHSAVPPLFPSRRNSTGEQSKCPELGSRSNTHPRPRSRNVGKIENVAHRRAGRHREKLQQRQAIAAARAERAVQREEARQRQERELSAKQAEFGCAGGNRRRAGGRRRGSA